MAKQQKTDGKTAKSASTPQDEVVAALSAMGGVLQKHGEAIEGIMGAIGISGNGSGGGEGVVVEADAEQGAEPGQYPFQRGFGQDQAKIELTQLAFNPKDSKLSQFTETPRAQVQPTSALEAYNIYIGNMEKMTVLRAQGRVAEAEAVYEPMESIFIRCRDKRMLSVSRRSRMEILKFNEVQGQREQAEEGQEQGF